MFYHNEQEFSAKYYCSYEAKHFIDLMQKTRIYFYAYTYIMHTFQPKFGQLKILSIIGLGEIFCHAALTVCKIITYSRSKNLIEHVNRIGGNDFPLLESSEFFPKPKSATKMAVCCGTFQYRIL
jgi:hypothetical protein